MKKQINPLTEEQRELVELNHDLIFGYAKRRNLSVDDYYDILAIGLCKAASSFDKNKGTFATLAYSCMENEVYRYWRRINRKSAIPQEMLVSYDVPIDEDSDNFNAIVSNIADDCLTCDIVMDKTSSSAIMKKLTDDEKKIIYLIADGYTYAEISKEFKCTRQYIGYCVEKIRKKCISYA